MAFDWGWFLTGLVLLFFPADRLLSAQVSVRGAESFQSLQNSPRRRPWWWVPALWLDPVRGLLGTWLVRRGCVLTMHAGVPEPKSAYAVMLAVLFVAVLVQLPTRRSQEILLAPIGFMAGMVGILVPLPVAVIGLAAALGSLFAFRAFSAFFTAGLAVVAVLGLVLQAPLCWLLPAVGLLAVPVLAALLSQRSLELPTRSDS
ncbi:MAG: hypothetical protein ACHQ4G_03330 [Opitutales bacterium]